MPINRCIARLNRIGLNRLTRHIAPWAPGFGLVVHRGRTTGKIFTTPVNVFARSDKYIFALTYGLESDWVKNVRKAGGCELETRLRTVHLTHPRLERHPTGIDLPPVARAILRTAKVHDFLILREGLASP